MKLNKNALWLMRQRPQEFKDILHVWRQSDMSQGEIFRYISIRVNQCQLSQSENYYLDSSRVERKYELAKRTVELA